jgi:iron complex outermembrane recepter protein
LKNNQYKKLLAGFSFLLLSCSTIYAQHSVAGKVISSDDAQIVEYAVVKVFSQKDTVLAGGAITDENGFFKITTLKRGPYYLEISSIGFHTKRTTVFVLNSSIPNKFYRKIPLKPSESRLKEAQVSGQRSFVKHSIDRKSYTVEDMAISKGSSVSEILEVIPSVDVDIDGNISLRGSQNLTVLIDGKPMMISNSDLQSLFETLPANSIKKVEVITNPSAKYDPDGMAGIINIVTKRNKLEGFFGNVNVGAAYNGRYNLGGMLNIKQGKWSTMLSAGASYRDQFSVGSTFRRNIGDTNTILDQNSNGGHISLGSRVSLRVSYDIDQTSTLSITASQNLRGSDQTQTIDYINGFENQSPFSTWSRESETDFSMNFSNYKFDYTKDFKGDDHQLNATVFSNVFFMDISSSFVQGINELSPSDWGVSQQRNKTRADMPSVVGQIDYVRPMKKNNQLEIGGKSINKSGTAYLLAELFDSASGTWLKESLWSNDYQVDEGIHSVYAVYKQSIKKFGYQVGLRLEKAYTDAFLLEGNDTFHNEYFSPFPSVHLSYELKKNSQLKASYSRRVNRPGHRTMRPFADYSDPLNIRQGNPFLLPEYINSYEVEYSLRKGKTMVSTGVYAKEINGLITRVKTVSEGIATTTYKNLGSAKNYGLELVVNSRFNKNWRMTFSSNAYRTEIDGGADSELNSEGYMVSSKLLTSYKLLYGLTVQASGRYSSPRVLPQGEISAITHADLAIQKRLLKNKASLNFKVSDIFNTRSYAFITEGSTFYQDSYRKRESRFFQLSFQYNFGEFKSSGRRRNTGSREGGSTEEGIEID